MLVPAESDSDESDRRPARRRRVEAAQADDMDEDEVLQKHLSLSPFIKDNSNKTQDSTAYQVCYRHWVI